MIDLHEQVRVYTGDRCDLWPYVPPGTGAVLDVGCATGEVGAALKARGKACEVVGLELSPGAAAEACRRLDRVIEGDVEAVEVPYPDGYFDLLLYADVLLVFRGRGQQRKRLVQMVALYTVQVQGTANGKGRVTRSLKITYQPRKPVQALLAASARMGRSTATRTTHVTILPQRHQQKKHQH